jgi:HSP20 family protein
MSIVRWSPFREVETLNNEMNRLFSRLSGMSGFTSNETGKTQWMLPMDVVETQDALKLRTALAGVNPEDVNIEINENVLTISAERRDNDQHETEGYRWIEQQYGTFSRSVTLPRYADTERIEASFNNGLLELVIPKKESAKPRRVQLKNLSNGGAQPMAIEASATSTAP